jgi:hypothetical protein
VRHAAEKKLKMYFMALFPLGAQMIDDTIDRVLKPDFPELQYGRDYVNLGFKSGNEAVVKVVVTNLRELYTTDVRGTGVQNIPMMQGITSIQQMKLIINVSAGYPGTKEWVQYAVDAVSVDSNGRRSDGRRCAAVLPVHPAPDPRSAWRHQGCGRV